MRRLLAALGLQLIRYTSGERRIVVVTCGNGQVVESP